VTPYKIMANGKQYYRLIIRMPDGKRRVVQAEKLRDLDKKKQEVLKEISLGLDASSGKLKLQAFLKEFLKFLEEGKEVSASTLADYRYHTDSHIVPKLGHHEIRNLTSKHVDDMAKGMMENGYSAATVSYSLRVLTRALNFAVDWRYIDRNPASARSRSAKRRRPQLPAKRIFPLTLEQAQILQQGLTGRPDHALFLLALTTGMRPGEILGLHWRDIDFEAKRVTIHTALRRTKIRKGEEGERTVLGPTKNDESRRTIDLATITLDALTAHKTQQRAQRQLAGTKWQNSGLVFTTGLGTPLDISNVLHRFQACCESLKLPKVRFYDLRHTHASLLIAQGLHPKLISERLGHSSIKLTMDTYGHLFPGADREAASHMDKIFAESAKEETPARTVASKVVEIRKKVSG
jgi:integrase